MSTSIILLDQNFNASVDMMLFEPFLIPPAGKGGIDGMLQNFALQNCNIFKQGSENCPVNLSNRSSHYVIKSSTKDDWNPQ